MTFDQLIALVNDQILTPIITLLALGAFILFAWGMFNFIRSAGEEEGRTLGRRHMVWGIIGMVIIFGANALISFMSTIVTTTLK